MANKKKTTKKRRHVKKKPMIQVPQSESLADYNRRRGFPNSQLDCPRDMVPVENSLEDALCGESYLKGVVRRQIFKPSQVCWFFHTQETPHEFFSAQVECGDEWGAYPVLP